ncbi:hypothetical protein [Streptomyces sp. NPDC060184]|uniref:hypothetical protein n=1 Tax=Streptomyces sp. NPDC060184 TaxID=3347064 RepID=UPI003646F3D6
MASTAHSRPNAVRPRDATAADVSGRRNSAESGDEQTRVPAASGGGVWPTQSQVWNWTESVVLGGYGPAAGAFL